MSEPFAVKDCALIPMATGKRAYNLRELRLMLEEIDPSSIYYHFWGSLLSTQFDDPEFKNDFAIWTFRHLHDQPLAEQLSIIDPTFCADIEELRRELIEVIEERLSKSEYIPWAKGDQYFSFIKSQLVVFDTKMRAKEPVELKKMIPKFSIGSVFYHFIDARKRLGGNKDDFTSWLLQFGKEEKKVVKNLAMIDPYSRTLSELRMKIAAAFNDVYK